MNRSRVAELLREQARIAAELAAEFESGDDAPSVPDARETAGQRAPAKPRERKPRARSVPLPRGPLPEPTELDKMRARQMARRRGIPA